MPDVVEVINIDQIKKLIPHRPFLLIDRVENVFWAARPVSKRLVAMNPILRDISQFSGYAWCANVEALAQTASVMVAVTVPDLTKDKLVFFTTVEKVKFRQPVRPGDIIKLHVVKNTNKGPLWKFVGKASVDGKVVAEANFGAMVVDPDR